MPPYYGYTTATTASPFYKQTYSVKCPELEGELYLHMGDDWIVCREAKHISMDVDTISYPSGEPGEPRRANVSFDFKECELIHNPSTPPVDVEGWEAVMGTSK